MDNPSALQCKKCVSCIGEVMLQKTHVYCRKCFLTMVTHKFRATLGKFKLMKPDDRVLFAFSGDLPSSALLHLILDGMKEHKRHKRLFFAIHILYIDEGAVINQTVESRKFILEDIKKLLENCEYSKYFVTMESVIFNKCESLQLPINELDSYKMSDLYNTALSNKLQNLFSSLYSMSSKQQLLYTLRRNLLWRVACNLRCNKIFTAETGDDLAIRVLSDISMGKAEQLAYNMGVRDDRNRNNIKFIHPLREFSLKEVAFYNVFNKIDSTVFPTLSTELGPMQSIHKLTESFLMNLQTEFPSTMSTIVGTGNKLQLVQNDCPFCGAFGELERNNLETNFNNKLPSDNSGVVINGIELSQNFIFEELCYSCRIIMKDMKSIKFL